MSLAERDALRKDILDAWAAKQSGQALTPLQTHITAVIEAHPEYHSLLNAPNKLRDAEFTMDNNPFLHIAMHISLDEQLRCDRPAGITKIWQDFLKKYQDTHQAQHTMMAIMGEIMWEAQQSGSMPSDDNYLWQLKKHCC